jgi:hypothetical protein
MRRVLALSAVAVLAATPVLAQDVSVGSCAGVEDVYVGTGGVSAGGAWVSVADCLGPKA